MNSREDGGERILISIYGEDFLPCCLDYYYHHRHSFYLSVHSPPKINYPSLVQHITRSNLCNF